MGNDKRPKTIGFLNQGKDNTFINVSSEGFDVGFQDEGERSRWFNARVFGSATYVPWYHRLWGVLLIAFVFAVAVAVGLHFVGW